MKKSFFVVAFACLAITVVLTGCRHENTACDDAQMRVFVDKLMAQMTLEEKLGQLNLPVTGNIVTGAARESNVAEGSSARSCLPSRCFHA